MAKALSDLNHTSTTLRNGGEIIVQGTYQEIINNEAHPLVYGDTLVEFLELVKKF